MEFLPWRAPETEVRAYVASRLAVAAAQGFAQRGESEIALLQAGNLWRELREPRWAILSELSVVAPLDAQGWVDGVIDLVAHDEASGKLLVIDWKTNRQKPGEAGEALLQRLLDEYRPQLDAYGRCLRQFFPNQVIALGVYATGCGDWRSF